MAKDALAKWKVAKREALKGLKEQRARLVKELAESPIARKIAEIDSILRSSKPDSTPATTRSSTRIGSGKKLKKGMLKDAILSVLGSGSMTHADIKAALSKKLGRPASNQYILLAKLVKAKALVQQGKGKGSTYSAK